MKRLDDHLFHFRVTRGSYHSSHFVRFKWNSCSCNVQSLWFYKSIQAWHLSPLLPYEILHMPGWGLREGEFAYVWFAHKERFSLFWFCSMYHGLIYQFQLMKSRLLTTNGSRRGEFSFFSDWTYILFINIGIRRVLIRHVACLQAVFVWVDGAEDQRWWKLPGTFFVSTEDLCF